MREEGAPYVEFACWFREFMKKHGFDSPADVHRVAVGDFRKWKKPRPGPSQFWESFYGTGTLSKPVLAWCALRFRAMPNPIALFPIMDKEGKILKTNNVRLPGQREMKLAFFD